MAIRSVDVAEEAPAAEPDLLHDLDRLAGAGCADCQRQLCGHQVLCSVALGFKDAPRCLPCLARGLDRDAAELRGQLLDYIHDRDCYRRAWDVASDREGVARSKSPACLSIPTKAAASAATLPLPPPAASGPEPAAFWDAGHMACGDLVLALRGRLNALPAGAVLRVTAHDPAAPEDLPAWCRLTGHRLQRAAHPTYDIRRKET
jgi:tRNA 2-thiouridine synthesizing protein A